MRPVSCESAHLAGEDRAGAALDPAARQTVVGCRYAGEDMHEEGGNPGTAGEEDRPWREGDHRCREEAVSAARLDRRLRYSDGRHHGCVLLEPRVDARRCVGAWRWGAESWQSLVVARKSGGAAAAAVGMLGVSRLLKTTLCPAAALGGSPAEKPEGE